MTRPHTSPGRAGSFLEYIEDVRSQHRDQLAALQKAYQARHAPHARRPASMAMASREPPAYEMHPAFHMREGDPAAVTELLKRVLTHPDEMSDLRPHAGPGSRARPVKYVQEAGATPPVGQHDALCKHSVVYKQPPEKVPVQTDNKGNTAVGMSEEEYIEVRAVAARLTKPAVPARAASETRGGVRVLALAQGSHPGGR